MQPFSCDTPRYVLPRLLHTPCIHTTDMLIIGGGIAGLTAALRAAEHAATVTLISQGPLVQSNSARAQGGVAAALDSTDSPTFHTADTLIAGAGLSDVAAVTFLTNEAPAHMEQLANYGVPFERVNGQFALGLEASHSHRRIVHVGDMTGLSITTVLAQRVRRSPHIRVLERYKALDFLGDMYQCRGALVLDPRGRLHEWHASATIVATGGAGALYGLTSNHPSSMGEGIAMAYRLGAEVADMEFVQFHPTVMRTRTGKGFLISEATRGEGGVLLTPSGKRFMPTYDERAELAPRDIVTRGIYAAMQQEKSDHVLLNLTHLSRDYFQHRFPTIYARCIEEGIDPITMPIPVAPAAHYLMGGIRTNLHGATTVPGLYAAGECSCTGMHGANRLASNSVLECLVTGNTAAQTACEARYRDGWCRQRDCPPVRYYQPHHPTQQHITLDELTRVMRTYAGPLRVAAGLETGIRTLESFQPIAASTHLEAITLANALLVARLIMSNALAREESRGAHYRSDIPTTHNAWQYHLVQQRDSSLQRVTTIADIEYHVPQTIERISLELCAY